MALKSGRKLSKHDAAALVPCHQRTAQRVLTKLHKDGSVKIVGWVEQYYQKIPAYLWGKGEDKPKPAPLTPAEKNRRYLSNPEIKDIELKRRRARRIIKGAFRHKAPNQIFNLIVGTRNGMEPNERCRNPVVDSGHSDDRSHQVF